MGSSCVSRNAVSCPRRAGPRVAGLSAHRDARGYGVGHGRNLPNSHYLKRDCREARDGDSLASENEVNAGLRAAQGDFECEVPNGISGPRSLGPANSPATSARPKRAYRQADAQWGATRAASPPALGASGSVRLPPHASKVSNVNAPQIQPWFIIFWGKACHCTGGRSGLGSCPRFAESGERSGSRR